MESYAVFPSILLPDHFGGFSGLKVVIAKMDLLNQCFPNYIDRFCSFLW